VVLLTNVAFVIFGFAGRRGRSRPLLKIAPPSKAAALPANTTFVIEGDPGLFAIAPPKPSDALSTNTTFTIVGEAVWLKTAPPSLAAVLFENTVFVIVGLEAPPAKPLFTMAPPTSPETFPENRASAMRGAGRTTGDTTVVNGPSILVRPIPNKRNIAQRWAALISRIRLATEKPTPNVFGEGPVGVSGGHGDAVEDGAWGKGPPEAPSRCST
jgi:hypothetical protein